MIQPSEIRFADEKIKEAFYKLENGDPSDKEFFRFINQAIDNIEKNAFCGIQVLKKQIPREYIKNFGTTNLWKYDLPNAWRLIYTIRGGKAFVVSVILEWMTHREYERKFNY